MTWLKDILSKIPVWKSLPEPVQSAILALIVALVGWLSHRTWGDPKTITVEKTVVKTVEVPAPAVVADGNGGTHAFGWVEPTPQERMNALASIKANQGGLDPDFAKIAHAAMEAAASDDPVFTWEAELKVLKKLLPCWNQGSIGSCVSHGVGRAAQDCILIQIANGAAEKWPGAEVAREPIYGGSRVEIGGGRIRGDGSINAWAVDWLQKYGTLFQLKYPSVDLSDGYNVSRCRDYGQRGCPDALEAIAKERPFKTAAIVKSANEIAVALRNGYPVCIASDVGFDSPLVEGFCARRGSWAHSMCVRGVFRHPTKGTCFVIQNSWGDYVKGDNFIAAVGRANKVQLPVGCFACTSADMDAVARQGDSFALSGFVGFPRKKIDWSVKADPDNERPTRFRGLGVNLDLLARLKEPDFALAP